MTDKDDSIPMSEVIAFFEKAVAKTLKTREEEDAKLIWEPVNRYTRSPEHGRGIKCSLCNIGHARMFHFSWSAIMCPNCKEYVPKNMWLVVKKKTKTCYSP